MYGEKCSQKIKIFLPIPELHNAQEREKKGMYAKLRNKKELNRRIPLTGQFFVFNKSPVALIS